MPLNKSEFEKVSSEHQAVEKETERDDLLRESQHLSEL